MYVYLVIIYIIKVMFKLSQSKRLCHQSVTITERSPSGDRGEMMVTVCGVPSTENHTKFS